METNITTKTIEEEQEKEIPPIKYFPNEFDDLKDGLPSIVPFNLNGFYNGPVKTHWKYNPFINNNRNDELEFYRWSNDDDELNLQEWLNKQNTKVKLTQISKEVYEKSLKNEEWSFEETKYLIELCEQYDLRFLVILDRYQFDGKNRSLEDIKHRFYQVYQVLNPNIKVPNFNKAKEQERKKQLEIMFNRKPEEIQFENQLSYEIRKLRKKYKAHIRQRDYLHHLLNIPQRGNQWDVFGDVDINKQKKKRGPKKAYDFDTRRSSTLIKEEEVNILEDRSPLMYDTPLEPLSPTSQKKEKIPVGAYLRSSRIAPIRPTIANMFVNEMNALDLSTRPFMPTERMCARFEEVQDLVLQLIESKKQLDKLDSNSRRNSLHYDLYDEEYKRERKSSTTSQYKRRKEMED